MRVKEVMKHTKSIDHGETARKAASLMKRHNIGSLVVTNSNKAKGIITERDLLNKVTAENKTPSKIKVKDIMSKSLITIGPDESLDDAVYLMLKHKIKRLPVVKDDELLGILSSTEIVKHSDEIGEYFFFD